MARRTNHAIGWLFAGVLLMALGDIKARAFTFAVPLSTGVQSVTMPGTGFTGKALLLWSSGQASAGVTDGFRFLAGMATAADAQVCRSAATDDNDADPDGVQLEHTDAVYVMAGPVASGSASVIQRAAFVAFTGSGFQLNWTAVDGTASIVHALVLGGADLDAALRSVLVNSDNVVVNDVGFRPDTIITYGGGR